MVIDPAKLNEAIFKIYEGERKQEIGSAGFRVHLDRLADLAKDAQKAKNPVDPAEAAEAFQAIEANRRFAQEGAQLVNDGLSEIIEIGKQA